jgi:hypothetical protein
LSLPLFLDEPFLKLPPDGMRDRFDSKVHRCIVILLSDKENGMKCVRTKDTSVYNSFSQLIYGEIKNCGHYFLKGCIIRGEQLWGYGKPDAKVRSGSIFVIYLFGDCELAAEKSWTKVALEKLDDK